MEGSPLHINYLFKGGTLITMNPTRDIIENSALAIKDGKILWVGTQVESEDKFNPDQCIDFSGKVLIPGLINSHGHWAMTLFRGLVDDCTLEKWLAKIWQVEAEIISKETAVVGAQLAMLEMVQSGTTCAADMYWYYAETTEAAREFGFRIVNGPSFAEIAGFEDYRHTNEIIAQEYLETYSNVPLVHPCIQAHSAYTTNPEILENVLKIQQDYQLLFVTHASESKGEMEMVRERYGKTSIEVLDSFGLLSDKTLLAHCVHLNDAEIERLVETGTSVAHCPSSNLKLSSGIARISEMVARGVNVSIGTDGPASNNDLDLFHEAQLAALVQKGVSGDPRVLPAQKVFSMLTIDGAQALGLKEHIGSIEEGKFADLALVDFNAANLTPVYDYYSHLIYAISASDVTDVMINGQMLMQDRKMLNVDSASIKDQVRKIGQLVRDI
jgi:5-methylthioadenosine/S-adenosylhomocysteine deaminase